MEHHEETRRALSIWISLLSAVAGFINLSTMNLRNTSTTHYSGNLSKWVLALFQSDFLSMRLLGGMILCFFLGGVFSGILFSDRIFLPRKRYGWVLFFMGVALPFMMCILKSITLRLYYIALNMGIQNSMFIIYRGMLVRTTHFTGYLSDAGFELGRAISGNRESLKKVSFYLGNILWFCVGGFLGLATSNTLGSDVLFIPSVCYIVMGLYFLDMRHEVYKYEKK